MLLCANGVLGKAQTALTPNEVSTFKLPPHLSNTFSHGDVVEDSLLTAQAHASTVLHQECWL